MSRLLVLMIVGLLSVGAWSAPVSVKEKYPERYVVKKGDTLWDIAAQFLNKPWQWPQIWNRNSQIKNPNLIYPGDVLRLQFVDGKPVLSVQGGAVQQSLTSAPGDEIFSEVADVRNRLEGTSVPLVPLSKVQGFLNTNRVVNQSTLKKAPYVLAIESQRIVAGKGDKLYARGAFSGSKAYSVYRAGRVFLDPINKQPIGREAKHIADVNVEAYKEDIAELRVESSSQEIKKMDFLLPRRQPVDLAKYYPNIPDRYIKGKIIAVKDEATRATRWSIITIDKGHEDGLRPGNVLAVYRVARHVFDPKVKRLVELPAVRSGEVVVFRIFNNISYAIVARVSDAIAVGDSVESP